MHARNGDQAVRVRLPEQQADAAAQESLRQLALAIGGDDRQQLPAADRPSAGGRRAA
jgi:hypothetical protein